VLAAPASAIVTRNPATEHELGCYEEFTDARVDTAVDAGVRTWDTQQHVRGATSDAGIVRIPPLVRP